MQPTIHKFGGAALADGAGFRRVCSLLAAVRGQRPVAVVSASKGVTKSLEHYAREAARGRADTEGVRIRHRTLLTQLGIEQDLLGRNLRELALVLESVAERRELTAAQRDFVLSIGERMSARILARALRDSGMAATPVDAFDLGLVSDSNHGRARPLPESGARIRAVLEGMPGIPVVTGFVAADSTGTVTTLGRNGSDLTASLLAEALAAREVQFWKPVGGVMTADPAWVPKAREIERLGYDEAHAYAQAGARVLHPDAVPPLQRAGIEARVRSILAPQAAGTIISSRPAGGAIGIAGREREGQWVLRLVGDCAMEERVTAAMVAQRARALHARHFELASSEIVRSAR
jgi:aspartate kinase